LAISALAALVLPVGCTSLLGDFSAGPTEGGTTEGGVTSLDGSSGGDGRGVPSADGGDATMPPGDDGGGQGSDGAQDDAASLKLLACNTWDNPTPAVILQMFAPEGGGGGGNNIPIGNFTVDHIPGNSAARLVVGTGGSTSGITVATIAESFSGNASPSVLPLAGLGLQGERKTPSGVAFLAQDYATNLFEYYTIADDDPGTANSGIVGPMPTFGNPPSYSGGGGGSSFQMTFIPMAAGGYYTLASYSAGTQFDVAAFLPAGAQWNSILGPTEQLSIGSGMLLQDGTNVYGFYAPPGMGGGPPSALNQYTFPTDSSLGPASRSVIPPTSSETAAVAGVGELATGTYSLAFVVLSGAQNASLRVGTVSETDIDTFTIDDLASLQFNVQSDGGFFDTTPFNGHNGSGARWLSNGDLGALGSGGTGNSSGYTGLNFYVATPAGQWLVETAGTGNNVLPGQTIISSAFDLAEGVNDVLLKFDVAWVVQNADGSYSLLFNVLDCQI
jgi:hypothetical protein